ncbi:MAG TPA: 30S ribosomal protein S16 [Candidatus Nanoperiomorbaceae bacterium]|nr:30S ribosomal protein S16 [Candidatus Nanoperiomorbaceae bacterium]HMQ97233.1 30S ribosomal protein S16 [Candidatus Nanoperiomorbaceae bacterium]
MLAIRLKRTGRKAYATYRVAVQEAQRHPSSGKVVAYVGTYNPHTKEATFDKELVEKYLNNGAQPTPRIVKLLKDAKIKLPSWVKEPNLSKARATRNPEKLRKNAPKEEVAPEAPAEEAPAEEVATEATEAEATPAE